MKIFILFLLFTPSIFATQTRLLALGMRELDNDGSYYIKDDRNIFINPAHVNDYGNFSLFDVGGEGQQIGANKTTISTNEQTTTFPIVRPKALGGILIKSGSVVWGAYLGNESNTASYLRILGSSAAAAVNSTPTAPPAFSRLLPTADRQWDFFVGWGEKLQWGANFYFYNPNKDSAQGTTSNYGYGFRLGVKEDRKKDFNVNVSLANKVVNNYSVVTPVGPKSGTQEFEGNLGLFIGGSYQFEPLRLIAWIKTFSWDQSDTGTYQAPWPTAVLGGQNGTVKGSLNIYNLGIGNEIDKNPNLKFFWNLYLRQTEVEVKFNNIASAQSLVFPIVFASEANATEWLQFRASIYQNIIGTAKNKNYNSLNVVARSFATALFGPDNNGNASSLPASTYIQFGSSLLFGGLKIDGLLGMNGISLINFNEFYVRAAVSYRW